MLSGGIEKDQWYEIGKLYAPKFSTCELSMTQQKYVATATESPK